MKKTNNKGFSLVELIIVVAIMAILIGVLAPQYIKYVEKSRKSADAQLVESCRTALQVALTDDEYAISSSATGVVTINNTGVKVVGNEAIKAFNDYFGTGNYANKKFKSKTYNTTVTMDIAGDEVLGFKVVVNGLPAGVE